VSFTRNGLRKAGFRGFLPVRDLLARSAEIPAAPGVYVYLRESADPPVFLERSSAGWFKGLDPTIGLEELRARWIPGSPVVYVGESGNLRERLLLRARFAAGRAVGARGGRALWQLEDAQALVVAWRPARKGQSTKELERSLLDAFRLECNRPPFANLRERGRVVLDSESKTRSTR
jgi:hypothetical protein